MQDAICNSGMLPTSSDAAPLLLPARPMTPAGPHSVEEGAEDLTDDGRASEPSHLDGSQETDTDDLAPDSSILHIDIDLQMLSEKAQFDEMKNTLAFIEALHNASLNDPCANLNNNVLAQLQNPPQEPIDIGDDNILAGLDLFLGTINFPQDAYINS